MSRSILAVYNSTVVSIKSQNFNKYYESWLTYPSPHSLRKPDRRLRVPVDGIVDVLQGADDGVEGAVQLVTDGVTGIVARLIISVQRQSTASGTATAPVGAVAAARGQRAIGILVHHTAQLVQETGVRPDETLEVVRLSVHLLCEISDFRIIGGLALWDQLRVGLGVGVGSSSGSGSVSDGGSCVV